MVFAGYMQVSGGGRDMRRRYGRGGSDGGKRASENRSSITAGETMPLWPGGFPATPPFTRCPGRPLPVFEWQGKIPSPPAFSCKRAGDHSCTTARFSFLGRGVPGQPPPPVIFPGERTPLPPWWGVGRQPPPTAPVLPVSEGPRMLVRTGYNAGGCRRRWRDFLLRGVGGWPGTPLAGLGPDGALGAAAGLGGGVCGRMRVRDLGNRSHFPWRCNPLRFWEAGHAGGGGCGT